MGPKVGRIRAKSAENGDDAHDCQRTVLRPVSDSSGRPGPTGSGRSSRTDRSFAPTSRSSETTQRGMHCRRN